MQKILNGTETMNQKDNKLTPLKISFSIKAYKHLSDKEIEQLNNTTRDFFIL